MSSIFISYRRSDTQGHAQNLHNRLASWFDEIGELYFDRQNIDIGQHYPQSLALALNRASVVLVLIGPNWLDEINRRADLVEIDFVRHEVATALQRLAACEPLRVIPVLLGGASMPSVNQFLPALQGSFGLLCNLNAHTFHPGSQEDWENQFVRMRRLIAEAPGAPLERFRDRSGKPRPWRVIDHVLSPHFQDPHNVLSTLRRQLDTSGGTTAMGVSGPNTVALHGMGGIGKTQLALAYCYQNRGAYAGIWWLRAETSQMQPPQPGAPLATSRSPAKAVQSDADCQFVDRASPVVVASVDSETLLQQDALAACGAVGVVVPAGLAPSRAFNAWLGGQTATWLLVFDNADDPSQLRQHLPALGSHHVIITSRRPDWGGLARSVEVPNWTPAQGISFLQSRLGVRCASLPDAEALARDLGCLPLALEQAASYIEATCTNVAHFRGLWHSSATQLLHHHGTSAGYERAVGATLSLAFGQLSIPAKQLLRLCAFAAPEPLPERFFTEHTEVLPSELAACARRPLTWNEVAGELTRFALVKRAAISSLDRVWLAGGLPPENTTTELALTMHRLTQQLVRQKLANQKADRGGMLDLLREACPSDVQDPLQWPRLAVVLPHAKRLHEFGPLVEISEAIHFEDITFVLDRCASFLQFGLGFLQEARVLFELILTDRREVWGNRHNMTLASMCNLALVQRELGDLISAQRLEGEVLSVRRDVMGDDSPDTLIAMNNLALTLTALGDLDGARSLLERAQTIGRRVFGADGSSTLTSMHSLAAVLRQQGDLDGSCNLLEQVLATRRRILSEEHPLTISTMNSLAVTMGAQGKTAEAHLLEQSILTVRRRLLGEDHPETLRSMSNLAMTLSSLGDHAGARYLAEQSLERRRRVLGRNHPATLNSLRNLATIHWDLCLVDEAVDLMSQAYKASVETLGSEHPDTQESRDWLAHMRGDSTV